MTREVVEGLIESLNNRIRDEINHGEAIDSKVRATLTSLLRAQAEKSSYSWGEIYLRIMEVQSALAAYRHLEAEQDAVYQTICQHFGWNPAEHNWADIVKRIREAPSVLPTAVFPEKISVGYPCGSTCEYIKAPRSERSE